MRLLIDDPPRIFNLLKYQSPDLKDNPENQNPLVYATVGGEPVILPDPLDRLFLSFRSSGISYSSKCIILCGRVASSGDIRNHLGERQKDRWRKIGQRNKGYFLDIKRKTPLLACETLVSEDNSYAYNIALGTAGAKPLAISNQKKFAQEIAGFQTFIQASLDSLLESAQKNRVRKIEIPEHEVYASLTEVEFEEPD